MEVGHLIDFLEEYNKIHKAEDSEEDNKSKEESIVRNATQADWDALFG